jgi:hypothetical protein
VRHWHIDADHSPARWVGRTLSPHATARLRKVQGLKTLSGLIKSEPLSNSNISSPLRKILTRDIRRRVQGYRRNIDLEIKQGSTTPNQVNPVLALSAGSARMEPPMQRRELTHNTIGNNATIVQGNISFGHQKGNIALQSTTSIGPLIYRACRRQDESTS